MIDLETTPRTLARDRIEFIIVGGGTYEDLLPHSRLVAAFGVDIRCVSLTRLTQLKRGAGRPRDFDTIAELEMLREQQRGDEAP
jgi:hypothetical protein